MSGGLVTLPTIPQFAAILLGWPKWKRLPKTNARQPYGMSLLI
jgi:hypothetical protein